MSFRKLLLILLFTLFWTTGHAQNVARSKDSATVIKTDSALVMFNQKLFTALIANNYDSIKSMFPNYGVVDSLMRIQDSTLDELNTKMRYLQLETKIRRQYKAFRKSIKYSDFLLRHSTLDTTIYSKVKQDLITPYCDIRMYCKRKNYTYQVDYFAFQFFDKWYLAEKLRFHELEKKEVKKDQKQATKKKK